MSKNTKEQNDRHTKILMDMLKLPENKECAECTAKGPRWASANLGVFICLRCSGIHRNLGTHISFVRSVTLDTWNPDHVKNMQRMGNAKAKQISEANVPPGMSKPDENDDVRAVEKWIRDKYVKQLYKSRDGQPPEEVEERPKRREGRRNGRNRHSSDDEADEIQPVERPAARQPEPQQRVAVVRSPPPTSSSPAYTQASTMPPRQATTPQPSSSTSNVPLIDFDLGLNTGSSSQPPVRPASAPIAPVATHPQANYHAPSPRAYSQPPAGGDLLLTSEAPVNNSNQMKDSILSLFQQPAAATPYRGAYPAPGYGYAAPAGAYPQAMGRGMAYPNAAAPNPAYYGAPAPAPGYGYGYNNYQQPR